MDNSSVEKNNLVPGFSPKTQFGFHETHIGYPKMCDQLAARIAQAFEWLGFSVIQLSAVDNAPTLFAVYGAMELAIIVDDQKTEAQQEWAGEQSTAVVWCNDIRHARDIAKAARRSA